MLQLTRPFAVCLVVATASAQLAYWVPVPLNKATIGSEGKPHVITQGLHLGFDETSGYADDTPPAVITHGPRPGAYTAVSSDEPSESTQFHSQDGLGQFLFGHSSPQQARLESRSADGTVRGSYSYINPEGRTIKVTYTAGVNGFQPVEDATGDSVFPRPVTDTPEVKAARALHARLFEQARWQTETANSHEHQFIDEVSASGPADNYHQPDSLYTNMNDAEGSDETLEYYGAAKGTQLYGGEAVRKPSSNSYAPYPDTTVVEARTSQQQKYPQTEERNKIPLAFTGAYHFPRSGLPPLLSPASAPTLREQQHLHRVSPTHQVVVNEPFSSYFPMYHGYGAPFLYSRRADDEYKTDKHVKDSLEYFGAAKLHAYSAANMLYKEPAGRARGGKSLSDSKSLSSILYHPTSPVFVGVAVKPEATDAEEDDGPSIRTSPDEPTLPSANTPSISVKAAYFGAVPVAAVHDSQVAPGQSVKDHQKLPLYIEKTADK